MKIEAIIVDDEDEQDVGLIDILQESYPGSDEIWREGPYREGWRVVVRILSRRTIRWINW